MSSKNSALPNGVTPKERLVYGLLFLFPIAGVTVDHWFSAIYMVLALLSLVALFRGSARQVLFSEERIWLWLCAAFFISFLISALLNGWGAAQNRALEVAIRYLLVAPLFLMLRRYPGTGVSLLLGALVAAFVVAGQAYYDVYHLGKVRAEGFYSPNLLGPVAALMVMYLLVGWQSLLKVRWLAPLAVVCGLWAVALSGSRGGYAGLMVMVMGWALLMFKGRWRLLMLAVAIALPASLYLTIAEVKQRVNIAVTEVELYLEKGVPEEVAGESSAIRFEMWRAAWMTFTDHPLLGVGDGNYNKGVQPYIDQKLVDPGVGHHGHPHNAYMNVLMLRGLVGYLILMAMLFYPLYYFVRTHRQSPQTALLGIVHIMGFALFSITDASTFDKNNFSSLYLLCMAVFLSWHAAQVHGVKEGS